MTLPMSLPLWILALASALIIYTDIATRRIPNRLILVALVCLIVDPNPCHGTSLLMMVGIVVLLAHLRGFCWGSPLPHTPRLGYGDIKLMLVLSLGLPLAQLPLFLILSGLGGVLIFGIFRLLATHSQPFPLGPALIIAFWIVQLKILNLLSFFRV